METFNTVSHAGFAILFLLLLKKYWKNPRLRIFNLSTSICYTLSSIHHSFPNDWILLQVDNFGVMLLILGTYLAIGLNPFLIHIASFIASSFLITQILNNTLYPTGYLIVGFFSVFCRTRLTSYWIGVSIYFVGEWINLGWIPSPWPHEIFHIMVGLASLVHFNFLKEGEGYESQVLPLSRKREFGSS